MSMDWIAGILAGVLMIAVICLFLRRRVRNPEYDERQRLVRGAAYQHAFMVILCYSVLYGILTAVTGWHFMEDGAAVFIGAFLGLGVFGVECVWKDAFFTASRTPGRYIILYAAVTLSEAASTLSQLRSGALVKDGLLTAGCMYPALALVFLSILVTILIKRYGYKEED